MKVLVQITGDDAKQSDAYLREVLEEMREQGRVQLAGPGLLVDVEIKVINP